MSMTTALVIGGVYGLTALTNPITQPEESSDWKAPSHHLRLSAENDILFSEDADYSHGTRLDYAQLMKNGDYWGASITQSIYTPYHNSTGNNIGERPYAGHLALGAGYIKTGENFGWSAEFQIGVTGNESGAQEVQDFVHDIGDMWKWDGWDAQMPSEVTLQLTTRQDFNIGKFEINGSNGWQSDSMLYTQQELGTVSVRAGIGYIFRYGKNLPQRMRDTAIGAANFAVNGLTKDSYNPRASSYFFVSSIYLEYVAHDIFLDGGFFKDSERTCGKQPWLFEYRAGLGLIHKSIDYYIGCVVPTMSYGSQGYTPAYGTLSIGWNW